MPTQEEQEFQIANDIKISGNPEQFRKGEGAAWLRLRGVRP